MLCSKSDERLDLDAYRHWVLMYAYRYTQNPKSCFSQVHSEGSCLSLVWLQGSVSPLLCAV